MKLLDEAPDPANPDQVLRRYDVPRKIVNRRVRVLVCANATRVRGGTRRTFRLTVPTHCRTATAAAAWTFDVPENAYTMPPGSKLVMIDQHHESGRPNQTTPMADILMLVCCDGGRERSPRDVHDLIRDAGLTLGRVRHSGLTMLVEGIAT